ncbi:hypothetical protein BC628DRAFT_13415 [Trametes gibbosa]|nr:hypothetical protein BC628DRAFT_13415 [Trametes gibbosa]
MQFREVVFHLPVPWFRSLNALLCPSPAAADTVRRARTGFRAEITANETPVGNVELGPRPLRHCAASHRPPSTDDTISWCPSKSCNDVG